MKCKNANAFPKKVNGCVEPTVWGSCLHYICDLSIWQRPDQGAIDSSPWLINFLSILAYGSARKSRISTVLFVLQYFPGYRHASSNFCGLRRNRKRSWRREVACWLEWSLVSAPCLFLWLVSKVVSGHRCVEWNRGTIRLLYEFNHIMSRRVQSRQASIYRLHEAVFAPEGCPSTPRSSNTGDCEID